MIFIISFVFLISIFSGFKSIVKDLNVDFELTTIVTVEAVSIAWLVALGLVKMLVVAVQCLTLKGIK